MKKFVVIAGVFAGSIAMTAASPAPAAVHAASPQAVADELLSADRAFSAKGEQEVLVGSISAMFADDVIMPLPNGTFAKGKAAAVAALKANPANTIAHAQWAPVRAGISADGQQGFTYGFMTIRETGKPDRRAKYLAYWEKKAGSWKVAAYKRAPSAEGTVASTLRPAILPAKLVRATTNPRTIEAHRSALAAAEKAFSDRSQEVGLGKAFIENGSADAMNMGGGPDFTFGNQAIGGGMPPDPKSPLYWAADERVIVSSSGDLGVSIGFIRPHAPAAGQPATIPFFTVWRRPSPQEPWRYIAE